MFCVLTVFVSHRKNGPLIGIILLMFHGAIHAYVGIVYVGVSFLFFLCWFVFWWKHTARFFHAELTSHFKNLDRWWSKAKSTNLEEAIDKDRCREEIVVTILSFACVVRELERGLWWIDISEEKKSFMSLVTEIHKSASDFGDCEYYGTTYTEALQSLLQAVDPQSQLLNVMAGGTDQQVGTRVPGPQAPSALQAPAPGAGQSREPSVSAS
jgi:hypothetical protein